MGPSLLWSGDGIGTECSTAGAIARHAQQRVQLDQGGQRDLRSHDEFHPRAWLALDHPLRDDDGAIIGSEAGKDPLARGRNVHPRRGERLAAQRVPRVMDGD
jgi:kynureninase